MPYADPDKRREMNREYARRYRERHPERVRESNRRTAQMRRDLGRVKPFTEEQQEVRRQQKREWYRRNRKHAFAYRLRWWRENGKPQRRGDRDRDMAVILLGDPCSYCGGPGGEVDHIEPWSVTEDGSAGNLTAACRSCNASKSNRRLLEYLLTC